MLTPEQVIADHMIPLQPDTELVSVEEIEGGFRVGAVVNAPPPPGYAATLTDAGWDVLDVRFGSETTAAIYRDAAICLIAYANYDTFLAWNHSTYFAVSVGTFADELGNRSSLRACGL